MTCIKFYVYEHMRATDNSVFYVGKGRGRRAWATSSRNKHWRNIYNKNGFCVRIVMDGLSEPCALTLEKIVIDKYGIANLANVVMGGGGTTGWKHSEETRKVIADSSRGRKISQAALDALRARRGVRLTEKHKRKLSLAKKGIPRGPMAAEIKEKIRDSHYGIKPSADTLEKMRKSKIGMRKRDQNNKFDATIRLFYHEELGHFQGTSYDLRVKYNIGPSCMTGLVSGKRSTAKGWIYKGTPND